MSRRPKTALAAASILAGVAATLAPTPSAFAETSETTVVARGLDNPRQLAFGPGQRLYVAEAGRGGTGPCVPSPEGGEVCLGMTGAITEIRKDKQSRVVAGLPSLANAEGGQATGPADVEVRGANVAIVMGLGGTVDTRNTLGSDAATLGTVLAGRLRSASDLEIAADLAAYEQSADPDGQGPDSNPTGFVSQGAKSWAVADAGGNSLVRATKGDVSTIATFPNREVPGPGGAPVPMQSVPTDVAVGPDGAFYVSELTGFPFPPGGSTIWRISKGGQRTAYATGLTNVTSLDWRGNTLYAVQISDQGLQAGPTGSLRRVVPNSTTHPAVAADLFAPYGLAIRGNTAYVTTGAVVSGGGEVRKINLR